MKSKQTKKKKKESYLSFIYIKINQILIDPT